MKAFTCRPWRGVDSTARRPRIGSAEIAQPPACPPLAPCPFCGGEARVEAHPDFDGIVRIACADERCGIRPATEYLLAEFRADLLAAWNCRPGDDARHAVDGGS